LKRSQLRSRGRVFKEIGIKKYRLGPVARTGYPSYANTMPAVANYAGGATS
jgi:hypothetical protein